MNKVLPLLGLSTALLLSSCNGGLPLPGGGTAPSDSSSLSVTGKQVYVNAKQDQVYGNGDLTVTLSNPPSGVIWQISQGEIQTTADTANGSAVIPYSDLNKLTLDGSSKTRITALSSTKKAVASTEIYIDDQAPTITLPASSVLSSESGPLVFKVSDGKGSGVALTTVTCTGTGGTVPGCAAVDSAAGTVSLNAETLLARTKAGDLSVTVTSTDRVGNSSSVTSTVQLTDATSAQSMTVTGSRVYINDRDAEFFGAGDIALGLTNAPSGTVSWKLSSGEVLAQGSGATATIPYSALNKQQLTGAAPVTATAIDDKKVVLATRTFFVDDSAPRVSVPASTLLDIQDTPVVLNVTDQGGSGVGVVGVTCTQGEISVTGCGQYDPARGDITFKQSALIGQFAVGKVNVSVSATDRVGNAVTQPSTLTLQGANSQGSVTITGKYVDDPRGLRFYGGEELKLTLSNTVVPAENVSWSSNKGEVIGSGYTASVPYSEVNKNALRGAQVTFTASNISTGQMVASLTVNVDDHAPQAVESGGSTPGLLSLETFTGADGKANSIPHLINPKNFYGNGVKFQTQYIDQDEHGQEASGLIPIRLDVWRDGVLLKTGLKVTDELVEGDRYVLRANSIADRLGNRIVTDALDLANFMYDKSAPITSFQSDFGLVLRQKIEASDSSPGQEQNPITFTADDAMLDDKSAGSGVVALSATCTQGNRVLSPCGLQSGNTITLLNDMMKAQGFGSGTFQIKLSAVDLVGSTLNRANPDLANHLSTTTYTVTLH